MTANNPVPSITSLSPSSASAGGKGFTLTVYGKNFVSGSKIQWNGFEKATTYISSTKLTAKISADDIALPGIAVVSVINPTPGGGLSNAVNFQIKSVSWIKSIWPALVELDASTLKVKDKDSFWEITKANTNPYGVYAWGLAGKAPGIFYFLHTTSKFSGPSNIYEIDISNPSKPKFTKILSLSVRAYGLAYSGSNLYVSYNNVVERVSGGAGKITLPENIGGLDYVADPSGDYLLAISSKAGSQTVYKITLQNGAPDSYSIATTIKAETNSPLYPYQYTSISYVKTAPGGSDTAILYVTKDDGTYEPSDIAAIVGYPSGNVLKVVLATESGIPVPPITWPNGVTSDYLSWANPQGIQYFCGRLYIVSLYYWNKGPVHPWGEISGYKWNDRDSDGEWDKGEEVLSGWTIQLFKKNPDGSWPSTPITETKTDQNGYYSFNWLQPGTYRVKEVLQAGWVQTFPDSPGYHQVELCIGQMVVTDLNFGNHFVTVEKSFELTIENPLLQPGGVDYFGAVSPDGASWTEVELNPSEGNTYVGSILNLAPGTYYWKIYYRYDSSTVIIAEGQEELTTSKTNEATWKWPFQPGDYCTYTQGGWGSDPQGNNPGMLLQKHFGKVYPYGVEVGIPGDSGYSMIFTSSEAINAYLPAGGVPGQLDQDLTDPTDSSSGVFGGQVLALKLNVDFSDKGITPGGVLGDLVLCNTGTSLDSKKVREILEIANKVLGGGAPPPDYTVSQLNDLVTNLNEAFKDGIPSSWAQTHLCSP